MHIETQEHLYWECHYIQVLWNRLGIFLQENNIQIIFNYEKISFGVLKKGLKYHTINFLILLMKYFINSMKYRKCIPQFSHFKFYLKNRILIEREIAKIKDKLVYHDMKWSIIRF